MGSFSTCEARYTNERPSLVRSDRMVLEIGYQHTPALEMAVDPAGYAAGQRRGHGAAACGHVSYSVLHLPVLLKHRRSLAG
jgi:hypothetical protein